MTHVATVRDVADLDLAHTWGRRFAKGLNEGPRLSSENPYMLVEARPDHFGTYAHIDNPEVGPFELTTVTIEEVLAPDSAALPDFIKGKVTGDFLVRIKEWLPKQDAHQLRDFERRASHEFVLKARGRPDVHLSLDGAKASDGTGKFQVFGAKITDTDRKIFARGVSYSIEPINTSATHRWIVGAGVVVRRR